MNQPIRRRPEIAAAVAERLASLGRPPRLPQIPDIFLHGMWRSGSTYVWSCFRDAAGTLGYYEPLAPGLDRLTAVRIPRDTPQMMAANRHPILDRPYFAEYAPLLGPPLPGLRGVKGFRNSFTFHRWTLAPHEAHPALKAYLGRLSDHARAQGRAGVFGFNQTGLRIGWLAASFDSYNIQVERDPRDIWASYMEHRQRGNFTYFRNWLLILERNAAHPLLAPLAARMPLRRGAQRLIKAKRFYAEAAQRLCPEELYLLVVYMWMACALHALSTCDLILDTGLADRRGYGFDLAAKVAADTGLQVDFSDLRTPPAAADFPLIPVACIERQAAALFADAQCGGLIDPSALQARSAQLTARKADLLGLALGA